MVTVLNVACWVILFVIVFTLGFIIGGCFLSAIVYTAGIIKFFDFEGNEISMDECNKLINEHFEELRKIPIK